MQAGKSEDDDGDGEGYEDLSLDDSPKNKARSPSPSNSTTSITSPSIVSSSSRTPTGSFFPQQTASPREFNAYASDAVSPTSSRFHNPSSVMARFSTQSEASSSRPPLSHASTSTSMSTRTASAQELENVPMVLGVAVVDFNHLIGPTVEFAYPESLQAALTDDEDLNRDLPFLALPDGAHMSEEDYSYFHCSYHPSEHPPDTDIPTGTTLFGISCNRQLNASELIRRPSDVTRTTVQKAVVVIASQPIFGPIRDQLGVVTRAFFAQRDFTQTQLLEEFYSSLEKTLEGKSSEGSIYIGTSLRDLVHKFRHRTLVLLKMLMLQKRIMLFGYPVEKLCTYQYSLLSLMPGLLMNLRDCGSPELDAKTSRARPTSLRSSDRSSLLRFMGLPLHLFGKNAFFQPYLPLQQMDMLFADSWLVGTTNQIVTQSRDSPFDLLVNIENVTFQFSDPRMERIVALTPWDRKWMDEVVRAVEETWELPEGERAHFHGSDDDLRSRFEEYICGALSSLKYAEFKAKAQEQDLSVVGVAGEGNSLTPFGELWLGEFRETRAHEYWSACTDPVIFDIFEPRHPCDGKATMMSDFSLRLTEGIHGLKLDQQLAPTREVLSSALTAGSSVLAAGSSSFWKTFDGVKADLSSRIEAEKSRREKERLASPPASSKIEDGTPRTPPTATTPGVTGPPGQPADIRATLGGIGSNIGSFFGSRVASFRAGKEDVATPKQALRPMSLSPSSSVPRTG